MPPAFPLQKLEGMLHCSAMMSRKPFGNLLIGFVLAVLLSLQFSVIIPNAFANMMEIAVKSEQDISVQVFNGDDTALELAVNDDQVSGGEKKTFNCYSGENCLVEINSDGNFHKVPPGYALVVKGDGTTSVEEND